MGAPFMLDQHDTDGAFPDAVLACREPNGLLAIGGDLSVTRLVRAYENGIFPWYNPGQPILWWSPEPRAVLKPDKIVVSRSLKKVLRHHPFRVSLNENFPQVIHACAQPRTYSSQTWIGKEMKNAYIQLHRLGIAHSVEAWYEDQLVGGLYGLALGRVFFGESMFTHMSNASKVAFVHLVKYLQTKGFELIDCQQDTQHLRNFGAKLMPRTEFIQQLRQYCPMPAEPGFWTDFQSFQQQWLASP